MAVRFWEIYEAFKTKYKLRILAGKNGMDNVIGWVHMLEDEIIVSRFVGEELAVTTCMKAVQKGWLLSLVKQMEQADCAGLIVNTGMYLERVPQDVINWCESHDFPLSKGTTFHTLRREQKSRKHNMRCLFPLFFA